MKHCCSCGVEVDGGVVVCKGCGGWTSVEAALPPPGEQVLCYTLSGYYTLDNLQTGGVFFNRHVSHWRPLPAPPRGVR